MTLHIETWCARVWYRGVKTIKEVSSDWNGDIYFVLFDLEITHQKECNFSLFKSLKKPEKSFEIMR